ncbi:MAG: transposase [Alphaproteobacteria bacterium]|nr:transposase [Alphaproteobacteria bacterium]
MSNIEKTQPIHPLRQRMIEDMTLRGISQASQSGYIRCVRNCCAHLKLAPGALTAEDVRGFLLHLQAASVSVSGINSHSTALRFFLRVTLKRGEEVDRIPILREHRRMPVVFTPEEVARIIACAPGLKYRTALSVTYGAGLRASETASLKVSNIDSRTMTLAIEQGKGYEDRKAKLSPQLLEALRKWWQITRPQVWLFRSLSPDGKRWVDCRRGFFLPVRVLSRLFRRLTCERLASLKAAGKLSFHGDLAQLADPEAFTSFLKSQRRRDWVVYAKRPFAGPDQVLSYLARYTHRIAISNSRITAYDGTRVTFRVKDYRREGQARFASMTLAASEFARRFLQHILPNGLHRIRHVGLLANTQRRAAIAKARSLLADRMPPPDPISEPTPATQMPAPGPAPCPCCGGRMILVELVTPASQLKRRPQERRDSS